MAGSPRAGGSCRKPGALAPFYGMLVWLNGAQDAFPLAGGRGFFAIGAGTSVTWVDPERRLVVVARWLDGGQVDRFLGMVAEAAFSDSLRS
jgi:CubicO group peptidase (beta-lactamase class C family)